MKIDFTLDTPIEHDVPWLALLASGVDGSAAVSRDQFTDELRRLRAHKECDHESVFGRSALDA